MELRNVIILAVAVALVTSGLVMYFLPTPMAVPSNAQTLPYVFMVGDVPGVDAATDIFRLGQVTAGGTSWRTLAIDPTLTSLNQENRTVRRVRVWARGEGASWLTIEPSTLTPPGVVKVTLHAAASAPAGTYRGVLVVEPLSPE